MQKMGIALILIIIGIIVIFFPLLGLVPIAIISGFLILMVGIGLILAGIKEMGESEGTSLGISLLILGIIAFILGIGFTFNPTLFAWLVGFTVWIIGIFLIIDGITRILAKTGDNRCGLKDIIIGIIILLVGLFFVTYALFLGVLVGLWLITTGTRMLYNPGFFKDWA